MAAAAGGVEAGSSVAIPVINQAPVVEGHLQDEVPAPYLIAMTGHGKIA